MNIGERIRIIRELRGWSQAELAERSRLEPSAISHFETGRRVPSVVNLLKLAEALTMNTFYISTDYLLGRTDKIGGILKQKEDGK